MRFAGPRRSISVGLVVSCLLLLPPVAQGAIVKAEALPQWISPDNPAYAQPVSPGAHDFASIHFVLDQPHNVSIRVFTPSGDFFRVLIFKTFFGAGDGYVQWDGLNDERTTQADDGTWPVGIYLETSEGQNLEALLDVFVDRIAPKVNLSWTKTADDTPRLNVTAVLDAQPQIPPRFAATFNGRELPWDMMQTNASTWVYSRVMPEENARLSINVTAADLAGNNMTKQLRFLVLVRRPSTETTPALIEVIEVPEGADWPPFPEEPRERPRGIWAFVALGVAAVIVGVGVALYQRRRRAP